MMCDIIGIGALNLDFILTEKELKNKIGDKAKPHICNLTHGLEEWVDKEEFDLRMRNVGPFYLVRSAGGSGFNAIQAIISMKTELKIGFVGVAGTKKPDGSDLETEIELTHMDKEFVEKFPKKEPGKCLSTIEDGLRIFYTYPGVNTKMAEYLEKNYFAILKYIRKAKIVHVTSFLDKKTPKILRKILEEAKSMEPHLKLSLDPGYNWLHDLTADIRGLIEITDYLFLSQKEFMMLGLGGTKKDTEIAETIFKEYNTDALLVVLEDYNKSKLFCKAADKLGMHGYKGDDLKNYSIEDSTGAGDVFAGGFLSALLIHGMEWCRKMEWWPCVDLGLKLVKQKLTFAGSRNFKSFEGIFTEFIQNMNSQAIDSSSTPQLPDSIVKIRDFEDKTIKGKKKHLDKCTIVIVSALEEELDYVLKSSLFNECSSNISKPTGITYWQASPVSGWQIIACTANCMGLTDAAILTTWAIETWNPECIIALGICGGRKDDDLNPGDIIMPNTVFHYQYGAYKKNRLERNLRSGDISSTIRAWMKKFATQDKLYEIFSSIDNKPNDLPLPKVVEAPMASADLVVKDSTKVSEAIEIDRKVMGIDMESYAIVHAALFYNINSVLVIKAVTDFADPHKSEDNNKYRAYAKSLSSKLIVGFIEEFLITDLVLSSKSILSGGNIVVHKK